MLAVKLLKRFAHIHSPRLSDGGPVEGVFRLLAGESSMRRLTAVECLSECLGKAFKGTWFGDDRRGGYPTRFVQRVGNA